MSSRWPRDLAFALLIAALLDHAVLGPARVWQALLPHVSISQPTLRVACRQAAILPGLAAAGELRHQVVVLGNSRAAAGIDVSELATLLPAANVIPLARPGVEAFQLRAIANEVSAGVPWAVVLTLSEFDTHRPIRLEPVTGRAIAGLVPVLDLVHEAGLRFAVDQREALYRLLLASFVRAYRFRDVLAVAGGARLVHFAAGAQPPAEAPPDPGREPIAYWDGTPVVESAEDTRRLEEGIHQFEGQFLGPAVIDRLEIPMVREITAGDHVRVQEALITHAVAELRAAGSIVVIVEAPMHPLTSLLYDVRLREEFRRFADDLVARYGVLFRSTDDMPAFEIGDFADLFHVGTSGRSKLTAAAAEALQSAAASKP